MAETESEKNAGQVASNSQERAPRDSLFLMAKVTRENDDEAMGNARIRNLSATGLMADCDFKFKVDDRLHIDLRGVGPVPGRVAWANGTRMGFAFDRAIDPQRARKPVSSGQSDTVPVYLRYLSRSEQFKN